MFTVQENTVLGKGQFLRKKKGFVKPLSNRSRYCIHKPSTPTTNATHLPVHALGKPAIPECLEHPRRDPCVSPQSAQRHGPLRCLEGICPDFDSVVEAKPQQAAHPEAVLLVIVWPPTVSFGGAGVGKRGWAFGQKDSPEERCWVRKDGQRLRFGLIRAAKGMSGVDEGVVLVCRKYVRPRELLPERRRYRARKDGQKDLAKIRSCVST